MPSNSNNLAPRLSLGNWISGGSLIYMPPALNKKASAAKPKESPKKVERLKEETKAGAPKSVSEGTDSPEDVVKKAKEIAAKAEADAQKAEEEAKKMADEQANVAAEAEAAAKKKVEDEEAEKRKKDADEVAAADKLKQVEDHAIEIKQQLGDLAKEMAKGDHSLPQTLSHGRYCSHCGRRRHVGACDNSPIDPVSNHPVVNVNVYGGADDATKTTEHKNVNNTATRAVNKDRSATKSKAKPSDSPTFTKEQDDRLLTLKSGGMTWLQISKSLGIASKYCIKRFLWLSGDKVSSTTSSDKESSLPDGHVDLGEIIDVAVLTMVSDAKTGDAPKNAGDTENENQKKDSNGIGRGSGSDTSKTGSNYKRPTVEDDSKNNESSQKDESKNQSDSNNKNESNDEPQNRGENDKANHKPAPFDPRTYVPISLAATIPLTGGRRHLQPDETWSVKELECLAELECRYRELKWMNISADFFNHTGRMVDPGVIKAKIMEATLPEEEMDGTKLNDVHIEIDLKDMKKIKKVKDLPNSLSLTMDGGAMQKMINSPQMDA